MWGTLMWLGETDGEGSYGGPSPWLVASTSDLIQEKMDNNYMSLLQYDKDACVTCMAGTPVVFLSVCSHSYSCSNSYLCSNSTCSVHRKMWQALGEMNKEEVQRRFAQLMDSSSDHSFLDWVTQKVKEEEEERRYDQHYQTVVSSDLFL